LNRSSRTACFLQIGPSLAPPIASESRKPVIGDRFKVDLGEQLVARPVEATDASGA
jgi:hypothetical protein